MKNKYIRLKAMILAGTIALSSASLTSCSPKRYNSGNELITIENSQDFEKKVFNIGEHIISVPINEPVYEVKQYNYHEGYKVVGIATSCYAYNFDGACIIFENEYPVECYSTSTDKNGNHTYENFGHPINFHREETNKTSNTKDFNIGEHIISIPIKEKTNSKIMQYEYHEGYEVVGIATADAAYSTIGSCVLYVNTQPVTCTLTENKDNNELYLSFGVPLEKEKTKTLE